MLTEVPGVADSRRVGDSYPLATGKAGAARLALLDRVYGADAERLMLSLGIAGGQRIADLGCGTGNTARWFAGLAGPGGEVVGVDVSPEQLALAQESATVAGHRNITFVEASAYDTGLPRGRFDVVHCRLLLCHLRRPKDALREMVELARPGGLVICFDLDATSLFSIPETACYTRARELILARGDHRGVVYTLGLQLPRLFREVGLPRPELAFFHPVYLRSERKRLWEYTFLEGASYMLNEKLCDADELARLTAELAEVAGDETIAVAQARMPVVWARKPA